MVIIKFALPQRFIGEQLWSTPLYMWKFGTLKLQGKAEWRSWPFST